MNEVRRLRLWRYAIVLSLAVASLRCASLNPGEDPLLVRAQQSYEVAVATADLLFKTEYNNRVFLEQKFPGFRAKVDVLRTRAKTDLPALMNVINAYEQSGNKDVLTTATAVIEQLIMELQGMLVQAKGVNS
jgi:hypothetical protein